MQGFDIKSVNIWNLEDLIRFAYNLHKRGIKIGFTHGCFDLLHISHVDLFKQSSKLCDFFIVGVESDYNTHLYKPKRPVLSEIQRVQMVSEIRCVNASFVVNKKFTPSDYMDMYKELSVDIVTFGHNYNFESKAQELTRKLNIEAKRINTLQQPTTTQIIERIKKL